MQPLKSNWNRQVLKYGKWVLQFKLFIRQKNHNIKNKAVFDIYLCVYIMQQLKAAWKNKPLSKYSTWFTIR